MVLPLCSSRLETAFGLLLPQILENLVCCSLGPAVNFGSDHIMEILAIDMLLNLSFRCLLSLPYGRHMDHPNPSRADKGNNYCEGCKDDADSYQNDAQLAKHPGLIELGWAQF